MVAHSPHSPHPAIPLLAVTEDDSLSSPIDRRSEVYRHAAFKHVLENPPLERPPLWTLPTILTFLRLVLVVVVLALWYWQHPCAPLLAACTFVAASFTDWLDGYLARRMELVTAFGAFLDPVADKIMVSTMLVLLAIQPPPPLSSSHMVVPVVLMICREVTMSSLREWAAAAGEAAHKAVKVNSFGKWKTALQMSSMSLLLFCRDEYYMPQFWKACWVTGAQVAVVSWLLLGVATILALWSLAIYFAAAWSHFVAPIAQKSAPPPPRRKQQ